MCIRGRSSLKTSQDANKAVAEAEKRIAEAQSQLAMVQDDASHMQAAAESQAKELRTKIQSLEAQIQSLEVALQAQRATPTPPSATDESIGLRPALPLIHICRCRRPYPSQTQLTTAPRHTYTT